jgi:lipoyl(octanoyl) transferase
MKSGWVVELGLAEYGAAVNLQQRAVSARKSGAVPDVLLLCEHPHVITLGRNGSLAHLHVSAERLQEMDVSLFETNRGGDITYHGPGQLVGYPILNLAAIRRDVAWYMRTLEEAMIRASAEFGVSARRVAGRAGVWVDVPANDRAEEEKLAAIGVHLSRWVTSHGFAYNVRTDLRYFDLIVPCGIAGKKATSLETLLAKQMPERDVRIGDVAPRIVSHLAELLDIDFRPMDRDSFERLLLAHEEKQMAEMSHA